MPGFMQQNDVIIGLVLVSHCGQTSHRGKYLYPILWTAKTDTLWWMWMMTVDTFLCVSELGL